MMAWIGIVIDIILVIVSGLFGFFLCACFTINRCIEAVSGYKQRLIQKIKKEVADTEDCKDVIIDIIRRS